MPVFNAQITSLEKYGPIIDLTVSPTPSALVAMKKAGSPVPGEITVSAMIDTGASASVICRGIAQRLCIYPIGTAKINTPTTRNHICDTYAVSFLFPDADGKMPYDPVEYSATVIEAPLSGQNIQCLLGRDFLRHGLLVYNGLNDAFSISL